MDGSTLDAAASIQAAVVHQQTGVANLAQTQRAEQQVVQTVENNAESDGRSVPPDTSRGRVVDISS